MNAPDIATLRRVLTESKTIAIVGLSADWFRPSYFAAKYMLDHGYRMIPVNPKYAGTEVLGQKCHASLRDIREPVGIVDCFRESADIPPIAEAAIAIGAKVLWMQIGVINEEAAQLARKAGADIVVHSATKYLGGHGTTMGGLIVESGKFPWDNGKFPGMTEPSRGYHGVIFHETFGDFGYTMKARMETLRTFGPALSPFNAFLLLQGVETLHLRMQRHCENALAVAQFLEAHALVEWVNYPGLANNRYRDLARKYLPCGASSILTFGIKGGQAAGIKFIEAAQFMSHLANVGDAKTLVIHPASTTHRQMSEDEQIAAGVRPEMIRLSIGLETLDDILWDIDQALASAAR